MYQQSVDKASLSAKKDLIFFIILIVTFFVCGAIMLYLENVLNSHIPRYVFIAAVLIGIYIFYRLRLIGFRYTVFYKELEPIYDPRFDAFKPVESYPYPVGTLIFERIVSAKGTIIKKLDVRDIISFEKYDRNSKYETKSVYCLVAGKDTEAYSLVFRDGEKESMIIFSPDSEFIQHINDLILQGTSDEPKDAE